MIFFIQSQKNAPISLLKQVLSTCSRNKESSSLDAVSSKTALYNANVSLGGHPQNNIYHDSDINTTVMLDGRITNALELCDTLQLKPGLSDSALVAYAYRKWGRDCPRYLIGEYAILIWDESLQTLFSFLDHMGQRKLYYYHDATTFACASSPHALHALPFVPRRPCLERIAAQADIDYLLSHPELSFFDKIYQLPSSTLLILKKGQLKLEPYWQPRIQQSLNFKSEDEYIESFQDLFATIVRGKLRGQGSVVSMLSGGLDSSLITAQAARILAEEGRNLTALSALLAPEYAAGNTDERTFVEYLKEPNLKVEAVTDAWRGPFDALGEYESLGHGSRYYLYRAFANAASRCGARVILDGCFGEFGPSFYGNGYLAEAFLRGRWPTVWQESRQWAVQHQLSWSRVLAKEVVFPLLPGVIQKNWYLRQDRKRNIGFIKACFTEQYLTNPREWLLGRVYPNHRLNQAKNMSYRRSQSSCVLDDVGNPIYFSYPYADPRLLEFCLALPGKFKVKQGYKRYALRVGARGLLPDNLRFRTCKQPFSPDYHERYNRDLPKARQFLADLPKTEFMHEIINITELKNALSTPMQTNRCSTQVDYQAMHAIPIALNILAFLSSF